MNQLEVLEAIRQHGPMTAGDVLPFFLMTEGASSETIYGVRNRISNMCRKLHKYRLLEVVGITYVGGGHYAYIYKATEAEE